MKKILVSFVIVMFLFSISGVIAQSEVSSTDFNKFIGDVVKTKGVNASDITDVRELNFSDLPDTVSMGNVDKSNLGLYQVDVAHGKSVFVITLSNKTFEGLSKKEITYEREYLNFGHSGQMGSDGFLETATGVEASLEKGYVMPRDGSITAISTNLDITKARDDGKLEIVLYKNGKQVQFGNTFVSLKSGVATDYDIQSENNIQFNAGDVISAYVKSSGDVSWSDVITIVEISTK